MALSRGVRFVLVFIGLAVMVSMAGVVLMYLVVSRGPTVPQSAALVLRPGGEIQEVVPVDVFGLLSGGTSTVRGFVEGLEKAKRDPRIRTVLLMPSSLSLPYWAKVQELRDAVLDFRKSGQEGHRLSRIRRRPRVLPGQRGRSSVYLLPTSPLDLTGVASYEIFLRGAFDKIGAYPDFLHVGEYKTAAEPADRKGIHAGSIARCRVAQSRHVRPAGTRHRRVAEEERRRRAGADRSGAVHAPRTRCDTVSSTGWPMRISSTTASPELRDGARRRCGGSRGATTSASRGESHRHSAALAHRRALCRRHHRVRKERLRPAERGDARIGHARRADPRSARRRSVKAIVLRIDSPGGSSVASDVIWRELMITRDQKPSRPLVASMSDLAASGGYYIAMPAQVIVAQPATLTGSIGIYIGEDRARRHARKGSASAPRP